VKSKAAAFGEICHSASAEFHTRSVFHSAQQNFTCPQGQISLKKGAVAECRSSATAFLRLEKEATHQECGKLLDFHEIWVQQSKPCPKDSTYTSGFLFSSGYAI